MLCLTVASSSFFHPRMHGSSAGASDARTTHAHARAVTHTRSDRDFGFLKNVCGIQCIGTESFTPKRVSISCAIVLGKL